MPVLAVEQTRDIMMLPVLIHAAHAGVISDATPVSTILAKILNFVLSIVGVLAIIGLVAAGMMYLTAAGDMRRIATAKNVALAAVIGIAIALGALVIVGQIAEFFS
jgi:hypothetical protein